MAVLTANLKKIQHHVDLTFGHASLVVKCTVTILCLFYLLSLLPYVYGVLAVTPGYLIPPNFRIWTLVTGGLTETSVFFVIADVGVLFLCARQLEPLWGALEFLKFTAIVNVGSCTATALTYLFVYLSTKYVTLWFTPFSGMTGVIGGVAVAFKQIMPDQKVNAFLIIRVQYIPSVLVLFYSLLAFVQFISLSKPILLVFGILIGWIYLRFYQPRGKGVRGDLSENFDFASFFPPQFGEPIKVISSILFNTLVQMGICKNPVRTYDVGAPSAITISLPGANSVDAERRRKKALRALNERMSKNQGDKNIDQNEDNWPSIDDKLDSSSNHIDSKEDKEDEKTNEDTRNTENLEIVNKEDYEGAE